MLIVRSTCSCASACGGDEARETGRSALAAGEGGWYLPDNEVASPNASELDSASLHNNWRTANLPKWVKSGIDGEATNASNRRAARGDWRERATKEHTRYPGDPLRGPESAVDTGQGNRGRNNPADLRRWKSERFVVAMKQGNSCRAKEPDRRRVSTVKGGAA